MRKKNAEICAYQIIMSKTTKINVNGSQKVINGIAEAYSKQKKSILQHRGGFRTLSDLRRTEFTEFV